MNYSICHPKNTIPQPETWDIANFTDFQIFTFEMNSSWESLWWFIIYKNYRKQHILAYFDPLPILHFPWAPPIVCSATYPWATLKLSQACRSTLMHYNNPTTRRKKSQQATRLRKRKARVRDVNDCKWPSDQKAVCLFLLLLWRQRRRWRRRLWPELLLH